MKKVLFFKNAVILTLTALILRTVGIFFRIWLADKIGAEGLGLYQVVFSVYTLVSTFATSGICTSVTRIVTEQITAGNEKRAVRTVRISVMLSMAIAFISIAFIFAFSKPISLYLIKDERAEISLKILCISLPFIGICSCLRGYFLARRSTLPPSICQMAEQAIRITVIVLLINKFAPYGIGAASAAVMLGDSLAEVGGALLLWLFYSFDKKHLKSKNEIKDGILKEIVRISVPISAGRYLHTGLRTCENLLTPICLSKYSASRSGGLEQFGLIKGMALPLLLFPASLLSSISTLLVPEMTEAMEKNNKTAIRFAIEKIIYVTAVFSFLVGGIFFIASGKIGEVVYQNQKVGYLIRALAPLVPFMYIDLIADGILKGLDQQNTLLRNNVIDSVVRILLVVILVPNFGMTGFLGVMLFSNLFTSIMSVIRIVQTTDLKFNFKKYFWTPFFAIFLASAITDKFCPPITDNNIWYIILSAFGITAMYFVILLFLDGYEKREFIKNFSKKLLRKSKKV